MSWRQTWSFTGFSVPLVPWTNTAECHQRSEERYSVLLSNERSALLSSSIGSFYRGNLAAISIHSLFFMDLNIHSLEKQCKISPCLFQTITKRLLKLELLICFYKKHI